MKGRHKAPLKCWIKSKILGIHSPSAMMFGTDCTLNQIPQKKCHKCKHNKRQQEWEEDQKQRQERQKCVEEILEEIKQEEECCFTCPNQTKLEECECCNIHGIVTELERRLRDQLECGNNVEESLEK